MVRLPMSDLPTGVMRGRFHPENGQLYACGLFVWAGNRTEDGGFYRIRRTSRPLYLPTRLEATSNGMRLTFTSPLDRESAGRAENYRVQTWSLKRSADYGSKHQQQRRLKVNEVKVSADGRGVELGLSEMRPTWCMEIVCALKAADGSPVNVVVHNTVHALGVGSRSGESLQ
jgi:hypothetical protein